MPLRTRRSVAPHLLGGPGPTPDELDLLLTVAARVPDHGRLTPWRFIVLQGEARHRIGDTIAAACRADHPAADEAKLALERDPSGPRPARRRHRVAGAAAREDPGMGADLVGRAPCA